MRIIGFEGASGTGKSHRAMQVAKENGIHYIIDDGILVSEGRIIAGVSAKKEETKLAAVRRAIFSDEEHAESVRRAIEKESPEAILILGTSEGMIRRIAKTLMLPEPERIIRIEEVAEPGEIKTALNIRKKEGKHVIPVPTFEIKRDFSGYLLDSLLHFLGQKPQSKEDILKDKSVVRPTFSYLGDFKIADKVVTAICEHEARKVSGVRRILKTVIDKRADGIKIYFEIECDFGHFYPEIGRRIQRLTARAVERHTSLNVLCVDVLIKQIYTGRH